tara:strand:+ start:959 stop:1471 length:513 start_codon:yes stop_codon:yes gene_type:complete
MTWLRAKRRWALYFRDHLTCVFCKVTLTELLSDPESGNFLTVDHIRARVHGGGNDTRNLVTCCYACNNGKSTLTVARFCRENGFKASTVRNRIHDRTQRPLARFEGIAEAAVGAVPGIPLAGMVRQHDLLVAAQWMSSLDHDYWLYLQGQPQTVLWCPDCGQPPATPIPF